MSVASPPKPWERANVASSSSSNSTMVESESPPAPPPRSSSVFNPQRSASAYTTSTYSPYNRLGTTTPYSRFGSTYGSSYGSYGSSYGSGGYGSYGGYGGYGGGGGYGGYGGYGGGGGGYGSRFGMGMGGGAGEPGGESLYQRMQATTGPTFQLLESVVGTFAGVAQMLESTYMATHSSLMAMVGVAEQFGALRRYLGEILSMVALWRFLKKVWQRIQGKQAAAVATTAAVSVNEFDTFSVGQVTTSSTSRKPLYFFLAIIIGIPWLISRLLKSPTPANNEEVWNNSSSSIPSEVEFVKALYDFPGDGNIELRLKKGDLIAVLSRVDPTTGQPSAWWRGRTRDGRVGLFPSNYVTTAVKKPTTVANAAKLIEASKEEFLKE